MSDLRSSPIKKTKYELLILDAREEGKPFEEMTDADLRYAADQIIVKGSATFGCDTPQTEYFAAILSKEITTFLLELGYETLTLKEVVLSLHLNTERELKNPCGEDLQTAKFTGNFVHVSFLASVLRNYMVLRNNLERKFQNHIDGY